MAFADALIQKHLHLSNLFNYTVDVQLRALLWGPAAAQWCWELDPCASQQANTLPKELPLLMSQPFR